MPQCRFQESFKKWLVNIILLIFSVAFAIGLAEIILHFSRYRYYLIKYPAKYVCSDNIAGYDICENSPAVREDQQEYSCTIWSNELGCFDKGYLGEKECALLVGDSFTFGNAPFEEKYGTLLESYLAYRILKCGVGGYGTLQEYFKIKKVVNRLKFPPRLIILGYWMGDDLRNDLDCLQQGRFLSSESARSVKMPGGMGAILKPSYALHHTSPSFPERIKKWLVGHSLIYHFFNKNIFVRTVGTKLGMVNPLFDNLEFRSTEESPWLKDAWEYHLNHIREIKKFADSCGSKLLVVLLPADVQVYDFLRPEGNYDFEQPNRMLSQFLDKEGVIYLDLTPCFRKFADQGRRLAIDNQRDLFWRNDLHFNKRGNKLAALFIAQYIIEHNLLEIQDSAEKLEAIKKELGSL